MSRDYKSVFDIIGPIMVGPSSSHTAGAARIGKIARAIFGYQPTQADIYLYGSFAQTYQGHHTDCALVGGLLDMLPRDKRLPDAIEIARKMGIVINFIPSSEPVPHPNTVKLDLTCAEHKLAITGISIGGGNIKIIGIDDLKIECTLTTPTILIRHQDVPGVIAKVTEVISKQQINISTMTVNRQQVGGAAFMIIEVDHCKDSIIEQQLAALPNVHSARLIKALL